MNRDRENPRREADAKEPRQPADVIRDGSLKASIWRNESDKGAFYATTFARTYRDESGEYRDSSSFVAGDLLKLSELARSAYSRTNALRREDRAQAKQEGSEREREAFRVRREGGAREPAGYKR